MQQKKFFYWNPKRHCSISINLLQIQFLSIFCQLVPTVRSCRNVFTICRHFCYASRNTNRIPLEMETLRGLFICIWPKMKWSWCWHYKKFKFTYSTMLFLAITFFEMLADTITYTNASILKWYFLDRMSYSNKTVQINVNMTFGFLSKAF